MGDLIAGVAADEKHQFRLMHDLVGRRGGVVAGAADGQAVAGWDQASTTQGGCDRGGKCLGHRQDFGAGAGGGCAFPGDDDDLLGAAEFGRHAVDVAVRGCRAVWRQG